MNGKGRPLRVGLLGGSFNPAHDGHRHISLQALDRLQLDQVWWLVSPQNPLKAPEGMAALEKRLAKARDVADHPRIIATDIERSLGTTLTAEVLPRLKRRFPQHRFVWLMGADNLIQIPRWHRWTSIFHTVAIAVFARPSYSLRALSGRAARRFARARVPEQRASRLVERHPPAWAFLHTPLNATSATDIRARRRSRRVPNPERPLGL